MKKTLFLLWFFLCSITLSFAGELKLDLETCYKNYSNAVNRYELDEIKKYMSERRYRHILNLVNSQKMTFPDDFIVEACFELVNLKKGKFLFAEENGNTANCGYYGRGVHHPKALIIINFIKEDSVWKYDGIKESMSHEIKTWLESNAVDTLKTTYGPNGVVKPIEKEISSVEYKGWFNMHSQGYLVYIKINGIDQDIYNDVIKNGVVMGGLKSGQNNVVIELIPLANVDKREIRISIRGFISEAERDVFHIYQSEGDIYISKNFEIKEYPHSPGLH